jgi:hypothetical protein
MYLRGMTLIVPWCTVTSSYQKQNSRIKMQNLMCNLRSILKLAPKWIQNKAHHTLKSILQISLSTVQGIERREIPAAAASTIGTRLLREITRWRRVSSLIYRPGCLQTSHTTNHCASNLIWTQIRQIGPVRWVIGHLLRVSPHLCCGTGSECILVQRAEAWIDGIRFWSALHLFDSRMASINHLVVKLRSVKRDSSTGG